MPHPETDTGPSDPHWGKKEQVVSEPIPLMIGTEVSRILGIPASAGNLVSHVRADGNGNMSSVLTDWKPWSGLSPDSLNLVPEILMEYKSSTSFPN